MSLGVAFYPCDRATGQFLWFHEFNAYRICTYCGQPAKPPRG